MFKCQIDVSLPFVCLSDCETPECVLYDKQMKLIWRYSRTLHILYVILCGLCVCARAYVCIGMKSSSLIY